jgi:hypothetical protein
MRLYAERTESIDRWIEGIKAVAGVGSLGSWVVFKVYPEVWGFIIVLSQVFTALKEQLPYNRIFKATSKLSKDLDGLVLQAESDWFEVANGRLDEEQIHKRRMVLKRKVQEAGTARFSDSQLRTKPYLVAKADLAASEYFATYTGE